MQSVVPFFIFSQSEVAHPSVLDFHDFNTIEDYRPAPWGHSLQLVYDISGSSTTGRITTRESWVPSRKRDVSLLCFQ